MSRAILGFNAYIHDTAAALLIDGKLAAFAEEERFRREKHTTAWPECAIAWCLRRAGLTMREVGGVAFYWRPWLGLARRLGQTVAGLPDTLENVRRVQAGNLFKLAGVRREFAARYGYRGPFFFAPHHLAHAYHAAFHSPFDRSLVLVVDGNGEIASTLVALHEGEAIRPLAWTYYPHSLGLLWCTATEWLGYRQNSDEGKVMGLAPYGEPVFVPAMRRVIRYVGDGVLRADMDYFDYHRARRRWFGKRWEKTFGPPRRPDEPLDDRHRAVAHALQAVTEEVLLQLIAEMTSRHGIRRLAMSGGVALNCVANGRIVASGLLDDLYIPPAAYDAGAAAGAALWAERAGFGGTGREIMPAPFLGPEYSAAEIEAALQAAGLRYEKTPDIERRAAALLAADQIVGWFQDRLESGPRALGNRSILADPRRAETKDRLNARVKHREPYRPFGPSILEERAAELFETGGRPSPDMLLAFPVRAAWRDRLGAVVHVDGSSRLQTVAAARQPRYHRLIAEFAALTGVPAVLNTSFNVMGEPIVCTPADALRCFASTGIDALAIGDYLVRKEGT
ncbi:MAG: hypothetical protein GX444_14115 [Myxococcales bacterium]|nr:hypothetical protein [Myxococcales bacterium]